MACFTLDYVPGETGMRGVGTLKRSAVCPSCHDPSAQIYRQERVVVHAGVQFETVNRGRDFDFRFTGQNKALWETQGRYFKYEIDELKEFICSCGHEFDYLETALADFDATGRLVRAIPLSELE